MRRIAAVFLAVILAACSSSTSFDAASPVDAHRIAPAVRVVDYEVVVPRDLTTSEAHLYYPLVDIVWREDAPGDRHAQVEAIFDSALSWGLAAFNRGRAVRVQVQVQKFHALSQKARYSVGGVHTIRFSLVVVDARTNGALYGPVEVDADLIALGGARAIAAEQAGVTQKRRITQHLAGTVQKILLEAGMGLAREPG